MLHLGSVRRRVNRMADCGAAKVSGASTRSVSMASVHAVVSLLQREPRVSDAKNRALRVCEFANRPLRKKQRIRPLEAVRAVHKVHHRVAVLAEHGVWVTWVCRGELEALCEWIAKDARLTGGYFVDGAKFPGPHAAPVARHAPRHV